MKDLPTLEPSDVVREVVNASVALVRLRTTFRASKDRRLLQSMMPYEEVLQRHFRANRIDIHKMAGVIVEVASEALRHALGHPVGRPFGRFPQKENTVTTDPKLVAACEKYLKAWRVLHEAHLSMEASKVDLAAITKIDPSNDEALQAITKLIVGGAPMVPVKPAKVDATFASTLRAPAPTKKRPPKVKPEEAVLKNPKGKPVPVHEAAVAVLVASRLTMGARAIVRTLIEEGWRFTKSEDSLRNLVQRSLAEAIEGGAKNLAYDPGRGFKVVSV